MLFNYSVFSRAVSFFLIPGEAKDTYDSVAVLHRMLLRKGHGISGYEKVKMPGVPRTISPLSFFFFSADGLTVTLRPSEIRSKEWT